MTMQARVVDSEGQRPYAARWTDRECKAYFVTHPQNFAGFEMSYPIRDAADVSDAARLVGHARDKAEVRARIISIARRLGLAHALPQAWQSERDARDKGATRSQEAIQILGQICEARANAGGEGLGHEVRVTVVKGGRSINGFYYDQNTLKQIAQMLEGARAYADHGRNAADEATRSVRDMIGFYKDACYVPDDPETPLGRVEATLHIMESANWLWCMIAEALQIGKPDLIGVSIDIFGVAEQDATLKARHVSKVLSLNSCDVVTRPSAGGAFQRILHATKGENNSMNPDEQTQEDQNTASTQILPYHSGHENSAASGGMEQADQTAQQAWNITEQQSADAAGSRHIQEAEAQRVIRELKSERCGLLLERRLSESILPQAARMHIKASFAGRIFEESELEKEISSMRGMLADIASADLIRDHGYEKARVEGQITEAEKVQAAFDRMFDLEIDSGRVGNVRGFSSIREAYTRVTGDASVGALSGSSRLGQIAISENAPFTRIHEADTTTASFSYLLGTSMNKRLLKDYQAWPAEWQRFCVIAPIKDFRQQSRVRLGAFGSLPTVAEDAAYSSVTLSDSAATYVPTKRGNLVTVSRETIINDDLQAIKQIPTKLAVAAAYTLAEFVYGFLSSNPAIYDGTALFTSGAPHSNLGAANLSSAAMQAGVTAMREQANLAGKRLGLRPSYLIVPAELEWAAMVATKSAGLPGSTNNDINPMLGYVTPIVSPQLTNTTQWFFAADPRVVDTIEIGFVGGQVNPVLFIQDSPLYGLNFTQDVIS
ncbi:MAG TPA: hypothetical protein VGD98_23260 [Ktedonobacteraceae bacterium]